MADIVRPERSLSLVTGECHPVTESGMRIDLANQLEASGDYHGALEYRAIVARMRKAWANPTRARMDPKSGPDPDAFVVPIATPEHPMFWHDSADVSPVCACGHFADWLCDAPVGRGMTCDIVLCDCCRTVITEAFDHCPFHASTAPVVATLAGWAEDGDRG